MSIAIAKLNEPEVIQVYSRATPVDQLNPKWLGSCRGMLLSSALRTAGFDPVHRETVSQLSFPPEIITATV